MSNRTKIKIRPPKPAKVVSPPPRQPKKLWQPPQSILAAVIFLALGAVILINNLYVVISAGISLIALMAWRGLAAHYSGAGSRGLRLLFTPTILIFILLVVRIYTLSDS